MHFQNPGFLWALLALAVPLVVHLFNLQRSEKVVFANTRMLERLVTQTRKARNLRHLLLLLLRLLAMACIIIAFAGPVSSGSDSMEGNDLSAVYTYLDNSPGMAIPSEEGSALERGLAFADGIPAKYSGKGWFFLSENSGKIPHNWNSASGFRDIALGVQKSPASRELGIVIQQAYRQFSLRSNQEKKNLFLVSDFQAGFVNGFKAELLDSNVNHFFCRVAQPETANVWADSAWTAAGAGEAQKTEIFFRLRSSGLKEKKEFRLRLLENESLQAGCQTAIEPGQPKIISLSFRKKDLPWRFLRLETDDPSCGWDNSFFMCLKAPGPLRVLRLGREKNPVLSKLFSSSTAFSFQETSFTNPDYSALETCDLLILDKPERLTEALKGRISKLCSNGKSVCLLPGNFNPENTGLMGLLPQVPALFPEPVKGSRQEKILQPEKENSFYTSAFSDPGKNPVLPEASAVLDLSLAGIRLLQFESGRVFLSKLPKESGNFFLFSSDPTAPSGSFHRHPLMLASFFRMAAMARKSLPERLFESRKQDRIFLHPDSSFQASEGQAELRNGNHRVLAGIGRSGKSVFVQTDCSRLPAGFWDVYQNGKKIDGFALNQLSSESETRFLSSAELKNLLPEKPWIKVIDIGKNVSREHLKAGLHQGLSIWKILLIAGIIFLIAESVMLKTMQKNSSQPE